MSWHPKLWEDVYDRLTGDATLTALVTTITNVWAPAGSDYPYVYFLANATSTEEAFNAKTFDVSLDVHTFVAEQPEGAGDPLSTSSLILTRLEGDWHAQADRVPTFGLDRYAPPLSASGWTASPLVHVGRQDQHEAGVYHFIDTFETIVSKPGA